MKAHTLRQVSPRSIVPPRGDAVHRSVGGQQSHALPPDRDLFTDYCQWDRCQEPLARPTRRRKYCSKKCAREAHLAQSRTWKQQVREETGHWPHPIARYWSLEKRREKGREYSARSRARKRQLAAVGTSRVATSSSDAKQKRPAKADLEGIAVSACRRTATTVLSALPQRDCPVRLQPRTGRTSNGSEASNEGTRRKAENMRPQ